MEMVRDNGDGMTGWGSGMMGKAMTGMMGDRDGGVVG
jgi:hypothetical protein